MIDLNEEPTSLPEPTNLEGILGLTTGKAFKMAVDDGAVVATATSPEALKLGNTEIPVTPETKKEEEKKNEQPTKRSINSRAKTSKSVPVKSGTKGNGNAKKGVSPRIQRGNKKTKS